jgi:hypothetical protein
MIRFTTLLSIGFLALFGFENSAAGQAAAEYGALAGKSATTAAPAKGLEETIVGMFDSLTKAVEAKPKETDSPAPPAIPSPPSRPAAPKRKAAAKTVPAPAPPSSIVAPPRAPKPNYEDPATIQAGTGYEELLRRFGPPVLEFVSGPNSKTMSYLGRSGAIQVEFQAGKVISAEKPKS